MRQVILPIGLALLGSACGGDVGGPPPPDEELPPITVQSRQRLGVDAFSAPAGEIDSLERQTGRSFGAFSCYVSWDSARSYPSQDAQDARDRGAIVFLNVNSFVIEAGVKKPICWTDISAGKEDGRIHDWANSIKTWGYEANTLITFEHEPNYSGDNQPKCPSDTPADYGRAFDHFYKVLRADRITAAFAYVPLVGGFKGCTPGNCIADDYDPPHADYQVIGTDAYNQPASRGYSYKDAHQALDPFYDWVDAQVPDKLKFIGEIGEDANDPDVANWYATASQIIRSRGGAQQLAVDWNVRTDPDFSYSPNLNPKAKSAFLTMASETYWGAGDGPTLVQEISAKGRSTEASTTLPGAAAGNLFVAVVAASGSPSVSAPPGWSAGPSVSGPTTVSLFYRIIPADSDRTPTFKLSMAGDWELSLMEVAGAAGTLDRRASNSSGSGTGTVVDSGTTGETTAAREFMVAGLVESDTKPFGLLSNGFALANKVSNGTSSLLVAYKTQVATGTRNTSVTLSAPAKWRGVMATFK